MFNAGYPRTPRDSSMNQFFNFKMLLNYSNLNKKMIISQLNAKIDFTFYREMMVLKKIHFQLMWPVVEKVQRLILHMKIEEKHHKYKIKRVNSSGTCYLVCSVKSCRCTAKVLIDLSFIKKYLNFIALVMDLGQYILKNILTQI
jgi:hypothetical protein